MKQDEMRGRLIFTVLVVAPLLALSLLAFVGIGWQYGMPTPIAGILSALVLLLVTVTVVHDVRIWLSSSWTVGRHRRDIYERLARGRRVRSFAKPAGLLQTVLLLVCSLGAASPVLLTGGPLWKYVALSVVGFATFALLAIAWSSGDVAEQMSALSGAVELPKEGAPVAYDALGAVSMALGLTRTPVLLAMPTASVNAWIAGPMNKAAIAVTRGMLDSFTQRELEAVFAGLLVRANDTLVSERHWWSLQAAPSAEFHRSYNPAVLRDAGISYVPLYSAADDAALSVLRDPSLLIDALGRTREALNCDVPGVCLQMAIRLWAWPVPPRTTDGRFDVQAERLRALVAVDGEHVNRVLATPERVWYFTDGDEQRGPVQESNLQDLAEEGQIRADAWVWSHGMSQWQPAGACFRVSPHVPTISVPRDA